MFCFFIFILFLLLFAYSDEMFNILISLEKEMAIESETQNIFNCFSYIL
jgi:hypothetical protein